MEKTKPVIDLTKHNKEQILFAFLVLSIPIPPAIPCRLKIKKIMDFKSRIKEVVFNDGRKQYFPQIKFECENKEVEWHYLRVVHVFEKRYEVRENDYGCETTLSVAYATISGYKEWRKEFDEMQRLAISEEIRIKNSIKETNYIDEV